MPIFKEINFQLINFHFAYKLMIYIILDSN